MFVWLKGRFDEATKHSDSINNVWPNFLSARELWHVISVWPASVLCLTIECIDSKKLEFSRSAAQQTIGSYIMWCIDRQQHKSILAPIYIRFILRKNERKKGTSTRIPWSSTLNWKQRWQVNCRLAIHKLLSHPGLESQWERDNDSANQCFSKFFPFETIIVVDATASD